jgi:2,4-dienoyl-CoA reductase-like NADH-dependent reductase (Old Yellow Enzyme family)/NADPH-dependent 2,4-dienoyl-CoA reductase/sulfur reductase-like enzyme
MHAYPNLFSPMTIRGKTFKNRILVAPMGIEERGEMGILSPRGIQYYEDIAAGGCARVCTGENDVFPGTAVRGCYNFYVDEPGEKFRESFRAYADVCHKHDALAFTSFNHTGAYMRVMPAGGMEGPGGPPMMFHMPTHADGTPYEMPDKIMGVSDMTIDEPEDGITRRDQRGGNNNGNVVHGMTREELEALADQYAHCAKIAKEVGLDGIILHGGHGFLFGQFISRRFNRRTDEFGGSMENRARFPIMVLERIRAAVGDDFLVEMRFSGEENLSPISAMDNLPGLLTIQDTVEFFQEVDKRPGLLDIAHISGGLHVVPAQNTRVTANSYYPMAYNVPAAEAVKKATKHIAVAVVGSLSDPAVCEDIIAQGKADFVVMARQLLIADPEFPNKAKAGRDEDINNCLRCTSCRASGVCAVNPVDTMLADHDSLTIRPTETPKNVVIVGGGIAGLKAAEVSAQRGHHVTLLEREAELGGILRYAQREPHKADIARYLRHMATRVDQWGVHVQTGTAATPESVKALHPDAVLVALGGTEQALAIPGGERAKTALSCYFHPDQVGQSVIVIGGGLTGCEAAIHWAEQGRTVTLLSRSQTLLPRVPGDGQCVNTHLILLHDLRVKVVTDCAVTAITDQGVETTQGNFQADTILNATGLRKNLGAEGFQNCAPVVKYIGDCAAPGLIGDATKAAYEAAAAL